MSGRLITQTEEFDRQAKEYGLATSQERLASPTRFRWDLIERDVNALLWRRRDLPAGSPGTYPEPLVDYLASVYLACCMIENLAPSQELVHLISQQLKVANFALTRGKMDARFEAKRIRSEEPGISNRELARRVGVNASQIGRWIEGGYLAPQQGYCD